MASSITPTLHITQEKALACRPDLVRFAKSKGQRPPYARPHTVKRLPQPRLAKRVSSENRHKRRQAAPVAPIGVGRRRQSALEVAPIDWVVAPSMQQWIQWCQILESARSHVTSRNPHMSSEQQQRRVGSTFAS
eukprot:COSAG02_NODE_3974_length_5968_cov_26.913466_2_plen_134_part_00